jgi:Uncharacterized conserved protein
MASTKELLNNPTSVGVWSVDPKQSTIGFTSKLMWGLASIKGHFTEFSGDGQITETQTIFGRMDIQTASIDTGVRKRDEHLRSADFFDAQRFPGIGVVVTSAESIDGDTVDLRAQLTVKGTTHRCRCGPRSRCSTIVRCAFARRPPSTARTSASTATDGDDPRQGDDFRRRRVPARIASGA